MKLTTSGAALAGAALLAACWTLAQSQSVPIASTKDAMRFKLFYAQGVLEGIATENYDRIATNSIGLVKLSQQAEWRHRATPAYQRFTADYARQAEALGRAAKNRNIDAATVAYFQLTVSCVNCHRYLRGGDQAGVPPEDDVGSMLAELNPKLSQ
jgi:hypothetical protein